jgi:hypothetical protein
VRQGCRSTNPSTGGTLSSLLKKGSHDEKFVVVVTPRFNNLYIVALAFVAQGNNLLGILYGASAVASLDQNQIFAAGCRKK